MEQHSPWYRLHLWQIQWVRDGVVVAGLIGAAYLGYLLSAITVPLIIGLFLADMFEPVVHVAMRWHPWVTRARMVIASAALALLCLACAIAVTLPPLVGQTRQLVHDAPSYLQKVVALSERPIVPSMVRERIAALRDALAPKPVSAIDDIPRVAAAADGPPVAAIVDHDGKKADSIRLLARDSMTVVNVVVGSISQIVDVVIFLFLVPFFTVLFSLNFPKVRDYLRSLAPETQRARVAGMVRRMEFSVGGFFRGRMLVCLILAAVYAIGLTICGVPYGLLLGLLTGLLCLIPYLHFVGLPIALALLAAHLNEATDADGLYTVAVKGGVEILWLRVILLPLGVWLFAQLLDDYVLSPLIQGHKTDLHPATVVVSILGGGILWGFVGIVIAVPAVACLKILFHEAFLPAVHRWLKGERSDPLPLG